jgi:type IV fimbrial biogenesis protein FimT
MVPMNGMAYKQRTSGFTLTELIIVMSIIAILAAIGVPSFKYVTTSNRIASEVNGLLGDMQYARSMAIKQGLPVTVCVSADQATCTGGAAWQSGWIVFLDYNNNQTRVTAGPGAEALLRAQNPFSPVGDTFVPDNGTFTAITFNREGYATTNSAVIVTLLLHDSTNAQQWTRCIAITPVGMLNTEKATVGNCI